MALLQILPRNRTWITRGKWVYVAKVAFEKYLLYKIRHDTILPIYKKYVLKALGIEHLLESDKPAQSGISSSIFTGTHQISESSAGTTTRRNASPSAAIGKAV